jgi:elongation factor G
MRREPTSAAGADPSTKAFETPSVHCYFPGPLFAAPEEYPMKVYDSADIRNVALVGHHGAGKTMLAEAMLFASGGIKRLGSIGDGTTVSDYQDSEHKRKMSIFAAIVHAEHNGKKINVLDTPGYPDFMGEVVTSLKVADSAVFVLNATDPVQVGTEVAWGHATKASMPSMFVLNHLDRGGIDFPMALTAIQERFGRAATALQIPVGNGSRAIIDLLKMKQLTFPEGTGEPSENEIDAGFKERADELHSALVENIAENDESLMEKYFEEGELSEADLIAGLKSAVKDRQMFPILLSSATDNVGISRVLELIGEACPSPLEGHPLKTDDDEPHPCAPDGDPAAFVYRTVSEQHVGEYYFLKIASGALEAGIDLHNEETGSHERLGGLFVLNGRNRESVNKANAGDLVAVVKLKDTHTNNTLHLKGKDVRIKHIDFPEPRYKAAIRAADASEDDKLSTGLHKLVAEDPSLQIIHDSDLKQLLLGGQGEMHIMIAKFRLKNRFHVDVELSIPKVSYRETILKSARAQYRHKKQTGGAGQFADVSFIVEPLNGEFKAPADVKVRNTSEIETSWGAKLELIDAIVSGVIDMRRFSGAIQKGIVGAMEEGPVAGYPCGDIRVVVYEGKMHSVDSNEAAFKSAARNCFKRAMESASPVLLEPICDLEVLVPDDFTGDVMSDLNTRRARIQGMEAEGANQKIVATAPEVELLRYSTQLRSLSQGRGLHTARFKQYEPMPRNVQDKIAEESKAAKEAAAH